MAVDQQETRELKERVVEINRVAKVVKGGRRFSFTALVVIGDEVDRVGLGYGKAREVPLAISKAVDDAKKNLFSVPRHGTTITHEILGEFGAARVLLRPASEGTGVIAGGGIRAVLELAGVRDILAKSLGTTNPINMLKATVNGLQRLRRPDEVAAARGLTISQVLPVSKKPAEEQRGAAARRSRRRHRRTMAKLKITQTRSAIGQSKRHRGTLRALGLGKIGRTAEHEESPQLAGMLRKVRHLVRVDGRILKLLWTTSTSPTFSRPTRSARASAWGAASARARAATPAAGSRARSRAPARTRCGPASRAARTRSTCGSASSAARTRRTRCRWARTGRRRRPVNVSTLEARFDAGAEVTPEALVEKASSRTRKTDVKILGNGELTKKLSITVHAVSASAREKIEAAGGTITLLREPKVRLPKRRPARRGRAEPEPEDVVEDEAPEPEAPDAPAEAEEAPEEDEG